MEKNKFIFYDLIICFKFEIIFLLLLRLLLVTKKRNMSRKLLLNFIPGVAFLTQEEIKSCPNFDYLRCKPNSPFVKKPDEIRTSEYVPIHFVVSVIFEQLVLPADTSVLQKYVDEYCSKLAAVIQKTMSQHYRIDNVQLLNPTWFKHGKFSQLGNDVKYDTKVIFASAIIPKSHEIDFWINCVHNLMY